MSEFSKQYREKLLPGQKHAFADTDPEFVQIFESFAFDEVVNQGDLDERTRFMAILAALLGCQWVDEFKVMLGCPTAEEAKALYEAHIPPRFFAGIYPMPMELLRSVVGSNPAPTEP